MVLIGACIAGLAVIAAIVALFLVNRRQEQEYREQMELGYHYLEQGNYEEAILAFNAALDIRPRRGEAYVGLGDAYTGLGSYDEALESYEQALSLDSSLTGAYLGLANTYLELGDIDAAIAALEEGLGATQDEAIEEWLAALRSMTGDASLQGTVLEYLPGGGSAPLAGAHVRVYTTAAGESRLLRSLTTDGSGAFAVNDLGSGSVTLHVESAGHLGLVTTEELETGTVNYTELFLLIPEVEGETGGDQSNDFYAYVTNALNNDSVPGAEVLLREGWNNTEGTPATTVTADDYGSIYVQGLDYGYYTAEVLADGFVTSFHNVAVVPDEYYTEWNLPMSPRLAEGETRIVLTWGETPYDLDSHLYNDDFHVYFSNKNYYQNSTPLVNLDRDDTSSYGPETITIYRPLDKDCTYYVYDYSNGGNSSNTQLSTSGATVRVYQTDGLIATFHVPAGYTGDRWTVFTLTTDGRLIPDNTIGMNRDYN